MPMHPDCRRQHLERQNYNIAIAIFLPMTAFTGKQDYLKEFYRPEIEAEQEEERARQFGELARAWHRRMQAAEEAGLPFDEPLPDYPEEPKHWWEEALERIGVWNFLFWFDRRLPERVANILVPCLIAIGIILTLWITLPVYCIEVQREWNRMHRRDREYRGETPCDFCGVLLNRPYPGSSQSGG